MQEKVGRKGRARAGGVGRGVAAGVEGEGCRRGRGGRGQGRWGGVDFLLCPIALGPLTLGNSAPSADKQDVNALKGGGRPRPAQAPAPPAPQADSPQPSPAHPAGHPAPAAAPATTPAPPGPSPALLLLDAGPPPRSPPGGLRSLSRCCPPCGGSPGVSAGFCSPASAPALRPHRTDLSLGSEAGSPPRGCHRAGLPKASPTREQGHLLRTVQASALCHISHCRFLFL